MKIIIPVINHIDQKDVIANGFNVTSVVCIYNTDTEKLEWFGWRDIIPEGTRMVPQLKSLNIESIITKEIHFLALAVFKDNGMEVYKSQGENLMENIDFFNKKELEPYAVDEVNQSSCGGACGTCETSCEDKK